MKKQLTDRIATLKARKEQMAMQLARLEARAKQASRKQDTRRKIVIGAAVISEMERTPMFAKFVREMLAKAVTRPQDREAIADLLAIQTGSAVAANSSTKPADAQEGQDKLAG